MADDGGLAERAPGTDRRVKRLGENRTEVRRKETEAVFKLPAPLARAVSSPRSRMPAKSSDFGIVIPADPSAPSRSCARFTAHCT